MRLAGGVAVTGNGEGAQLKEYVIVAATYARRVTESPPFPSFSLSSLT